MLTPRLQEVMSQIMTKSAALRSNKEIELLQELIALDNFLAQKSVSHQFSESVRSSTRITSGPGGCPCCGR